MSSVDRPLAFIFFCITTSDWSCLLGTSIRHSSYRRVTWPNHLKQRSCSLSATSLAPRLPPMNVYVCDQTALRRTSTSASSFPWRETPECAEIVLASIRCRMLERTGRMILLYEYISPLNLGGILQSQTPPVNSRRLVWHGPGIADSATDIVMDASRVVYNESKVPALFRLNGWFRTYMDSARIRNPCTKSSIDLV